MCNCTAIALNYITLQLQKKCNATSYTSGTPQPTGEKPNSEPSRLQVNFCEPTTGRFLPFVAS